MVLKLKSCMLVQNQVEYLDSVSFSHPKRLSCWFQIYFVSHYLIAQDRDIRLDMIHGLHHAKLGCVGSNLCANDRCFLTKNICIYSSCCPTVMVGCQAAWSVMRSTVPMCNSHMHAPQPKMVAVTMESLQGSMYTVHDG
jgi:hypothetical protein